MTKHRATKTIKVNYLARVEGEGALHVQIADDQVSEVRLEIFEPPRFFEGLLRGRAATEAPDITARICGICPVAYQMSAVHAVERIAGVTLPAPLRALRRLLYCGEWIESHTLHIYMLHAPDFLGFPDAITMAKRHPQAVERGLRIKKAGNQLVSVLAGREIHPINVKVGGFYKAPAAKDLHALLAELRVCRDLAAETVEWVAGFEFPSLEIDHEFVALRHPDEYPMNEGRLVSTAGLDIDPDAYDDHFEEWQVPHSTALHSRLKARGPYLTGPAARYNLNHERLGDRARAAAAAAGLSAPCRNPFQTIILRAVEVLQAFDEAVQLIETYTPPPVSAVDVPLLPGVGRAVTEAPRGTLYHRYRIGAGGLIEDAKIVPPTSQNQAVIEDDLRRVVANNLQRPQPDLTALCEQTIRNYDPCISCAAHFLKLHVAREPQG